jgi:DNA (cytosine-5)-methyltransferase 1
VTRLQGWRDEWGWRFSGLKTARYRQIGNAFPPPVAEAVGGAIRRALDHADAAEPEGPVADFAAVSIPGPILGSIPGPITGPVLGPILGDQDPVFRVLRGRDDFLTTRQIAALAGLSPAAVLERLRHLSVDFDLEEAPQIGTAHGGPSYRLGPFRAFLGQRDHARHQRFAAGRATIS